MTDTNTNTASTAHLTTLTAGLTIPVLTPRTNELNLSISGSVSLAAGAVNHILAIRDHALVTQWLFPFEEADLVAATLTINIAPNDGIFFTAGFCRHGATADAATAAAMVYKAEGYSSRYSGSQHVISLPLNHNFGRKIKGTNLGNPAPAILFSAAPMTTSTAVVGGRYTLNLVLAPSGVAIQ